MDLANVQGHFRLVNYQITQIRNALAISSVLGRAIIVPQLWCGQDRWWAPHAGVQANLPLCGGGGAVTSCPQLLAGREQSLPAHSYFTLSRLIAWLVTEA